MYFPYQCIRETTVDNGVGHRYEDSYHGHNAIFGRSQETGQYQAYQKGNTGIGYVIDKAPLRTMDSFIFKDSGNIVTNYYSISSTSDACTNVVATAITPSMFTTTLRSWRTRTNTPSTPSKMPPVIRTRVPWERFSSVGSR